MLSMFKKTGEMSNIIIFYEERGVNTCMIRIMKIKEQSVSTVRFGNFSTIKNINKAALIKVDNIPLLEDFFHKGFYNVTIDINMWATAF